MYIIYIETENEMYSYNRERLRPSQCMYMYMYIFLICSHTMHACRRTNMTQKITTGKRVAVMYICIYMCILLFTRLISNYLFAIC